jgi:hypothetical protein
MSQPNKLLDPNKTYLIGVWDMPIFVIDGETDEPVTNPDGTVALFNIPNYDYSYLCDGVDIDELELREEGDTYDNA